MAKKITLKITDTKTELTKKEKLIKLLNENLYKVFDQEPRGSIQSSSLNKLVDEILAL
jgi:hypothetical protein